MCAWASALSWCSTASMRCARPAISPLKAGGAAADAGIGFLNGVLGGITGLAGILVTIWCGLRGWPKDVQRTVFQPVAVAIFANECVLDRRQRRRHAGYDQAVPDRTAGLVRGHLARTKTVRPSRRGWRSAKSCWCCSWRRGRFSLSSAWDGWAAAIPIGVTVLRGWVSLRSTHLTLAAPFATGGVMVKPASETYARIIASNASIISLNCAGPA